MIKIYFWLDFKIKRLLVKFRDDLFIRIRMIIYSGVVRISGIVKLNFCILSL